MSNTHFVALETKHSKLEKRIESEASRPIPDEVTLHSLKKMKLRLKDEMQSIRLSA